MLVTGQARTVDLALVLLIDDSGSIDDQETQMQRSGYADAFRDSQIIDAMTRGPNQSIAVSVVLFTDQVSVKIPWKVVDSKASAESLANQIERIPRIMGSATHIAQGVEYSINHISRCPYDFFASTIDLSADGSDNQHASVDGVALIAGILGAVTGVNVSLPSGPDPVGARKLSELRNYANSRGITINCIAIEDPSLRGYFSQYVMAGPNAFTVFAPNFRAFTDAIQRKLLREINEGVKISAARQNKAPPAKVTKPSATPKPKPKPTPGSVKTDTSPAEAASDPDAPNAVSQQPGAGEVQQERTPAPMVVEVAPPVERRYQVLVRDQASQFPIDDVKVEVVAPAVLIGISAPEGRPGMVWVDLSTPAGQSSRIRVSAPLYQPKEVTLTQDLTEVGIDRLPLKIVW